MHSLFPSPPDVLCEMSSLDIVRAVGGLHEGHHALLDGRHSSGFLSKMTFLRHPSILDEFSKRIVSENTSMLGQIDVVVGPAMVGSVLASAIARQLNIPFTIVYKSKAGPIKFHRDFQPPKGTSCIFVDDILYSGKSFYEFSNF